MAEKKQNWLRGAAVGPHFVVALLIGFYFGYKVDQWLDTGRVFRLIGAGLGLAAGFINLFREVALINREEREAQMADQDPSVEPEEHTQDRLNP